MIPPPPVGGNTSMAAWLNRLLDYAKSNRIRSGRGYKVKESTEGVILEVEPGGGGATASAVVQLFKIVAIVKDKLYCHTYDSNTMAEGTAIIEIAKPFKLRGSIDRATIDGVTLLYTYVADLTTYVERDARIGATWIETQIILPRYTVGDVIVATQPTGGTGVAQATWQDINLDARAWARKFV